MNTAPIALRDGQLGELPLFLVETDANTDHERTAAVFAADADAALVVGIAAIFDDAEEHWAQATVHQLSFNPNNPFALDWTDNPVHFDNPNPETYRYE